MGNNSDRDNSVHLAGHNSDTGIMDDRHIDIGNNNGSRIRSLDPAYEWILDKKSTPDVSRGDIYGSDDDFRDGGGNGIQYVESIQEKQGARMNIKREIIAVDILDFCKDKNKRFITAKYTAGHIICSITKKPYTAHQLGNGFRILNQRGIAKKVSDNRWQILSYEFEEGKE
jgi:hypothetical protein